MFIFEKMNHFLSLEEIIRQNKNSQRDASLKIPEIIAKYNLGEQLSIADLYTIARIILPILSWSDERILSMDFLNACAELLFASEAEFWKKIDKLMLLFISEIYNISFHPRNSQEIANEMLQYFISTNKVDHKNCVHFRLAIHLLMKLYNRHDAKSISTSLNVYVRNFNMKLWPYPNNEKQISLSFFGYGHDKYKRIMTSRPPNSTIIKCKICKLEQDELTTIENLVLLIVENGGIECTCWRKFLEENPKRNIQPCSARGLDGSLCPFCDQYKEMQIMGFIGTMNDLFKDGLLSEDVYNGLFDTFCQIIIGGSTMPIMPLTAKLLLYLPSVSIELFQKLFHLINDFEIFFRRMKCLPRPNFLSRPNLRDFTKADYDAYMEKLKRGQEEFERVVPELGFCCCNEKNDYCDEVNRIQEMIKQCNHDKIVGDNAVDRFNGTRINCC